MLSLLRYVMLYVLLSVEQMQERMKKMDQKISERKHVLFAIAGCIRIVLVTAGILFARVTSQAATPRAMLSDYQVEEGAVVSGQEFTLDLEIRNYSAKQVKNLKVAISAENGEFIPVKGAGNAYIEAIEAGETEKVSFKLKAEDGLEERAYKVHVVTDYENPSGWEYKSEEAIFLPVALGQRLSVTDLFIDGESAVVGDTVEISAQINNMGEGALYNVMVKVEGDNIAETDSFVGTIEKGKTGRLDVLTKADIATKGDHRKNKMIITYENKAGEEFSSEYPFEVQVGVPVYENLEKIKESSDHSNEWGMAGKLICAAIVIAVVIYGLWRRQRRKQRILDEFIG